MIKPYRSEIEYFRPDDKTLVARVQAFDITVLNNAAVIPTAGYAVGSFQLVDTKNTLLSTGVVKAAVSNDIQGDVVVPHPTTTSLSAAGATAGVALEYAYFGAQVTTIQGAAGDSTVVCELWIVLKA